MANSSFFPSLLLLLTFIAVSPLPSATPPTPTNQHLSSTWLLESILEDLGFHELSMVVASLSDFHTVARWAGSMTLFAPSDASTESYFPCSVPRVLAEHIVHGLYPSSALQELTGDGAFTTTLETMNLGHCITFSTLGNNRSRAILVDGVEITRADLFRSGKYIYTEKTRDVVYVRKSKSGTYEKL